ncbi:MAG: cytochrome c oxidase assembly protein [Actinobacteria bacterium]|nr:MAG: cytochrome c oxidase assembly protein [Actinomycetota bacterium]
MLPPFRAHVDVWVILGSLAAAYLIACRRHAERTGVPASDHARRLFLIGVAVLLLGADWPIHDLAERYLYCIHMVQHLLFALVAAPLLVAGTPAWLWRDLLRRRIVRRVWRFLTRPLPAIVLFNGVLLFTHWPAVVTLSVHSELSHFLLHTLLLGSAVVMWWPVVSPLPDARPHDPGFVPDVRPCAALSGVRHVPAHLGHLGDDRSDDRGPDHEDRRRSHPVDGDHGRLLPLGAA